MIDVLLVTRGSRFPSLTPEGEHVLDWAERIVGEARRMRQELRAEKQKRPVGYLRLATIPTSLAAVSSLRTCYRERHRDVRFTVRSCPSTNVVTMLDNLEVDASISYLDEEPTGRARDPVIWRDMARNIGR